MTTTSEEWRPVLGYEGYYEVSDHGRVRSTSREILRADGVKQGRRGRVLSPKRDRNDRLYVNLSKHGRARLNPVSILVLEAFAGPRPDGMFGCHNNGIPDDNRAANLRWDTPSANNYDRIAHGRDRQASKTHCPRNHLLEAPNLPAYKVRQGHRTCLACDRAKHSGLKGAELAALADDHYRRITAAD